MKIHWILLAAGLSRRFGENKLLLYAHGVVASAVECVGVDAPEVTDTGQGDGKQPV